MRSSLEALKRSHGDRCEIVLLGSIASGKYVELLQPVFGNRLVFPPAFVGRGDMSRGGLLLRCVSAGEERLIEQERLEEWIMSEVEKGAALPGLYPPNAETKSRYEAMKNSR